MDEKLELLRLEALASHLYSGDEWPLVPLDSEDVGLPASTVEIRRLDKHYDGGLVVRRREQQSEAELLVEYDFDAVTEVAAVMAEEDAKAADWEYELDETGRAIVTTSFAMKGWAGVVYEGDEVRGGLEYIGMRRTDGTRGHPLARIDSSGATDVSGELARVYKLHDRAPDTSVELGESD